MQRIEADPVDEFGGAIDIPDREIAPFAGLERTSFAEDTQRARTFPRHAGEAFGNGHPEQGCAHIHGQQQRRQRRTARIAVGRERHVHAMGAEQLDRWLRRLANEIERARQEHSHRARPRHGRNACLTVLQMIRGQRGKFRSKRCPPRLTTDPHAA